MVLVDDGSSDSSLEICKKWSFKDKRIHVLHQENAGAFSARRSGYDYCKQFGEEEFITFLDADDKLSSGDALTIYAETIASQNADIVCANYKRIISSSCPIAIPSKINPIMQKLRSFDHDQMMKELYVSFFGISLLTTSLCDKIFRWKLLYTAMHTSQHAKCFAEDLCINMLAFPCANRITLIPDVTYLYSRGGGTSKFMPCFMDDAVVMYQAKLACLRKYPIPQNGELLVKIEMRNLLYTWLLSYLSKANANDCDMLTEIKRCADLPEIIETINTPEIYNHQHVKFSKRFRERDFSGVLQILKMDQKANTTYKKAIRYVKRLLHRCSK